MMKTVLHIEGMSCGHCVAAVTEALKALPGVASVKVHLKKKTGEVKHDEGLSLEALRAAVAEAGFQTV
jgi:copper chaperone CopZ